ncbi:nucleotidyltransferase domain-containing protein [Aeribacillus alveayuensis]|uniref:nucleotidyltransferase domain-containing protein n=1 Tax=Aeribacillus alveayuensis TaxID=279215 RepID=UPI003AF248EA
MFGSRARGNFKKTSDIDLALFKKMLTHSQQNLIENDIQQMSTPLKIDIVFFDRLTKNKLKTKE